MARFGMKAIMWSMDAETDPAWKMSNSLKFSRAGGSSGTHMAVNVSETRERIAFGTARAIVSYYLEERKSDNMQAIELRAEDAMEANEAEDAQKKQARLAKKRVAEVEDVGESTGKNKRIKFLRLSAEEREYRAGKRHGKKAAPKDNPESTGITDTKSCPTCRKMFSRKDALRRHMNAKRWTGLDAEMSGEEGKGLLQMKSTKDSSTPESNGMAETKSSEKTDSSDTAIRSISLRLFPSPELAAGLLKWSDVADAMDAHVKEVAESLAKRGETETPEFIRDRHIRLSGKKYHDREEAGNLGRCTSFGWNSFAICWRQARKISDQIDEQLRKERLALQSAKNPRILLLGSGDSGKTTVLKQMKILHGDGFTDEERLAYRGSMQENILDSIRALVYALPKLEIKLENPANEVYAARVKADVERTPDNLLPPEIPEAVKALWADKGIQEAWHRANEFFIQDTADYFLKDVDRFVKPDYMPTNEDILRARHRTTQITETKFQIEKYTYRFFDVGGQRSDRLFWAPYFEGELDAILFIVSLASYDQMLVEDTTINRMLDALVLFETIANNPLLKKVNIILFLNKADLFAKKIKHSNIKRYFPDFDGEPNDVKNAGRYVRKKFQSQSKDPDKKIYTHFTTGTDTSNMKVVISAVRDIVTRMSLQATGIW
ncbi:guanine nucleotide-binding protein subunit alpha [Borealophlyctis nickersoniae]|nr:guanine nucleotide-binding protein subunit alpha [Borealophlyctis nickersoniae]